MTVVAIVSDTHLPRGARRIPDYCVERMSAAELIVHAGDFATLGVLEELRLLGPPVVAVHGNVDEPALRDALPQTAVAEADGVRIGVIHDAGPATGRLERMRLRFPTVAAVVFGHSHIPLHEVSGDGFQIFNPGSPTDRRRQPRHTMGIAAVADGRVSFEHVFLD